MGSARSLQTGNFKAEDISEPLALTVAKVEVREFEGVPKGVLVFEETGKKLPLNQTNLNAMIEHFGDDFDNWLGQVVTLIVIETEFKGKKTPGIRLDL